MLHTLNRRDTMVQLLVRFSQANLSYSDVCTNAARDKGVRVSSPNSWLPYMEPPWLPLELLADLP